MKTEPNAAHQQFHDKPMNLATDQEILDEAAERGLVRTFRLNHSVPSEALWRFGTSYRESVEREMMKQIGAEIAREGAVNIATTTSGGMRDETIFSLTVAIASVKTRR